MKKTINKLREYGYHLHNDYWISSYVPGLNLYIKIGRKTKRLERVRDWFVRPDSANTKFRNYDCLKDAIDTIINHVNIINTLGDIGNE